MEIADLSLDESLDSQVGVLLAALDWATLKWRQELGDVPDEVVVWQPFPGGHSIGAVILHIAEVEAYYLTEVIGAQPRSDEERQRLLAEETDQYQVDWPTPPTRTLAWYYDQQDQIRARTKRLLAEIDDPLHSGINHDGRSTTLRRLLSHVIQHEAYHGGQAVLLSVLFEKVR